MAQLETLFGRAAADYCLRCAESHLAQQRLILADGRLRLTRSGIMLSDGVMADLMAVNDEF